MIYEVSSCFYPAIFASVWFSPLIFILNLILEVLFL